jgi:hypothetical protein
MVVTWVSGAPLLAAVLVSQADTASYWQQEVHYTITASLDEATGVLAGTEHVVYVNHSPDTLDAFYLHLYLNAFRPGSRWADRDSIEGSRRFNDLEDPDFAFNHVRDVRIDGRPVAAEYPYAPDSTIVRFSLPAPLFPQDWIVVTMSWDARPSTVPRRQGRRGRRFDFAQWYPRVVAYDRFGWQDHSLYPAGEFYGEFGTFDVTLNVAEDQVIGATGVPIEGDPGWERARADANVPVTYQRGWYDGRTGGRQDGSAPSRFSRSPVGAGEEGRGCTGVDVGPGQKCVRWWAEDVHHFALSLNPEYVYEEGRYEDVVARVLYLPGDRESWGGGVTVDRTVEALRWLDQLFGEYPWPQITNVHRIEGGGTEFPMMVMDGSASLGLILHEVGHNYLMGILANNEWKEGFLDEGFTTFQSSWYFEERGGGSAFYDGAEWSILELDLGGWSEPTSLVSEDYRDFATYGAMIYTRGYLFYEQLRYVVGDDAMRRILREYYARWRLKHVTETALLEVAEEVSGQDLKALFAQWLHGTVLYDYAIGGVERRQSPDGRWETTVEVKRLADGIIPVEIGQRSTVNGEPVVHARASGRPEVERVTFSTEERPGRLMLDPRLRTHDWNYLNNRERRFLTLDESLRFDTFVRTHAARDRRVLHVAPTVWYNDAGGVTVGLRGRSNYLGQFDRATLWLTRGVSGDVPTTLARGRIADAYVSLENPAWLRSPGTRQLFEAWMVEGRTGVRFSVEREHRASFATPDRRIAGITAQAMIARNREFLDEALWEDAGTAELYWTNRWRLPSGRTSWNVDLELGGGIVYALRAPGTRLDRRYDAEPFARSRAAVSMRYTVGGWRFGWRLFGGAYGAENVPLPQRAIPVAGADPYETFSNPLVRSAGAVLVRPEVFYHTPGNGNLRGYDPSLAGRWAATATLELERRLLAARSGPVRGVWLTLFGDGGLADTLAAPSPGAVLKLADAGAGLRFDLRIGDLAFPLRAEFPLWMWRPELAHNQRYGTGKVEFRWLISVQPTF